MSSLFQVAQYYYQLYLDRLFAAITAETAEAGFGFFKIKERATSGLNKGKERGCEIMRKRRTPPMPRHQTSREAEPFCQPTVRELGQVFPLRVGNE